MIRFQTVIHESAIEFLAYPFPPASVFPSGRVVPEAIALVVPGAAPPEIRLRSGEILFVPAKDRDALVDFSARNHVAVGSPEDIWALLLEPFLDTEFSDADQKKTLERLASNGVGAGECQEIRKEVHASMMVYNFGLWEWCHLGLFDLLHARRMWRNPLAAVMAPDKYAKFYWRAMEIAHRGNSAGPE